MFVPLLTYNLSPNLFNHNGATYDEWNFNKIVAITNY